MREERDACPLSWFAPRDLEIMLLCDGDRRAARVGVCGASLRDRRRHAFTEMVRPRPPPSIGWSDGQAPSSQQEPSSAAAPGRRDLCAGRRGSGIPPTGRPAVVPARSSGHERLRRPSPPHGSRGRDADRPRRPVRRSQPVFDGQLAEKHADDAVVDKIADVRGDRRLRYEPHVGSLGGEQEAQGKAIDVRRELRTVGNEVETGERRFVERPTERYRLSGRRVISDGTPSLRPVRVDPG